MTDAREGKGRCGARGHAAIEACCGHCTYCSPDCPVAIARRAMRGLYDDLVAAEEQQERPEER